MKKAVHSLVTMLILFALTISAGAAEKTANYHNSYSVRRVNLSSVTGSPVDTNGLVETEFLGIYEHFEKELPEVNALKWFGGATYKLTAFDNAVVNDGMLHFAPPDSDTPAKMYWSATTAYLNEENDPHFEESIVSFAFMLPELGAVESLYRGMFSTEKNVLANNGGPYINISESGVITKGFSGNYAQLEAGRWYRITLYISKSEKKFDMYLDGMLIGDDLSFDNIASESAIGGGLCSHRMLSRTEIYYDDYYTYKKLPGKTVYFAEDFSAMAGRSAETKNDLWYHSETIYSNVTNASVNVEEGNAVLTLTPEPITNKAIVRMGASKGYGFGEVMGESGAVAFKFRSNNDNNKAILGCMRVDSCSYGMEIWLEGNKLYFGRGGVVPRQLLKSDIQSGKWYSIVMVSDFTSIDAETHSGGCCTIYLAEEEGEYECLETNLRYNWIENNYPSASGKQINRGFEAYVYYDENYPDRSVSYDNIVLYDDTREDLLSSAMQSILKDASNLSLTNKTVSKPIAAEGMVVDWSANGTEIDGNDTVIFTQKGEKTYTVSVKTEDSVFAAIRKVTIPIPLLYEMKITEENGSVSGTVKVNAENVSDAEGYSGGVAVLAIYDNAGRLMSASINVTKDAWVSVTADTVNKKGSYEARLFFFSTIDSLNPLAFTTETLFTVE